MTTRYQYHIISECLKVENLLWNYFFVVSITVMIRASHIVIYVTSHIVCIGQTLY